MANEKKSASNRPFLYIVQPEFEHSQSQMQEYVVKKNRVERNTENSMVIKVKKEDKNEPQEEQEAPSSLSNAKQSFQSMSLKERVDFLLSIPKNVPQVPCVLEVNGKPIEGIILEKFTESLSFKQKESGNTVELNWKEIDDVRMV
ncbi:CotO family spore coat protein [Bacillus tianshenii]|nr:CotO family spore coat protein [Bacillus tianshenii]